MEMMDYNIEEKTYTLNLGPQHPSTHGVLRVLLEMEGEFISKAEPVIGYGHRAHEHMAENRSYLQFLPNMARVDYLHALAFNQGYCMAVEKLIGVTVPERNEPHLLAPAVGRGLSPGPGGLHPHPVLLR